MSRFRQLPEVNAGSMADIAFLLLIFFLVTAAIPTDEGLLRISPPEENRSKVEIKDRNLFEVNLNSSGELMVEQEIMKFSELREATVSFIDNGGISAGNLGHCAYCSGSGDPQLSENPQKAIIALQVSRETGYSKYVTVQNELQGAYNELRNNASTRLYGISFQAMKTEYSNSNATPERKQDLQQKIKKIQEMYPQKLLEISTTNF